MRLSALISSLSLAIAASAAPAPGQEVITIGSGVDPITYTGNLTCCVPLASAPFTPQDFADALAGPPAPVIPPVAGYWVPALSCGPDALWISPGGSGGHIIGSGLFACEFEVVTTGDPVGTVALCWAADDRLGDLDGQPNEIGVYVNGQPLGPAFRGPDLFPGGSGEASAIQAGVPLVTGTNTLHVYLRDTGAQVSGVMFHCRIEMGACGGLEPYCQSTANSTGVAAELAIHGTLSVAANDATLEVTNCPAGSLGLFVYGPRRAQYPFGNGVLCISPYDLGLIRMLPVHQASASGTMLHPIDFAALPPHGVIVGGSTWNFQLLYRDLAAGGAGFNASHALGATFCP